MKAYKLIWCLLKHPFADVVTPHNNKNYIINHTRYNSYYKEFLLESIDDGINKKNSIPNKCDKECWFDGGKKYKEDYNPCQDCKIDNKCNTCVNTLFIPK